MMSLYETLRRAIAMVLAVSMMLAVLPAAAAEEAVVQPLGLAEGEPVSQPLEPEGEPMPLPLDPEEESVVLPTDPDGGAVVLPEGPDDDTDLPTGGGTPVITWPDPDDTDEPDEPESDDPANIPVTLPLFPDEELDGAAAEGVCKDLITEIEDTGTEVVRWPEPEDGPDVSPYLDLEISCSHNNWKYDKTVPPTCEEDGYKYYKCQTKILGRFPCAGAKKEKTEDKLGHDWNDWATTTEPKCEIAGEESRTCKRDASHVDKRPITALVHLWDDGTFSSPYECVDRVKTQKCTRENCQGIKETKVPASAEHQYAWTTTKEPSCTEPGEEKYACACGNIKEIREIAPLGGDHELTHVVEPAACTENGCEYDLCSRCHYKYNEEVLPYPGHTAGVWKDQDEPGCCEQKFTTNCTVCGDGMKKTSPALREHKFSRFTLSGVNATAVCDYCGVATKTIEIKWDDLLASTGQVAAATGSTLASDFIAGEATKAINDVLVDTKAKVNAAQTKEEAIEALEAVYEDTLEKVLAIRYENPDLNLNVGLTQAQAEKLLKDLKDTMEDLQKGLSDSFLSKESVQDAVSKIVETTTSEEGTSATKKTTYELVFGEVYDTLGGPAAPEVDSSIDTLILQLAQTAAADDAYWDTLTENLINDVLDEALNKLKTSDKYKKYTNNKLFDEAFDEMSDSVRKQLVEDPAFINSVRKIVEDASAHAKEGIDKGWSKEKLYANLRNDLSGVDRLVCDQVESLGADAADMVEDKVSSTIKRFLPYNLLGLWLGDTVGGAAKDLVSDLIEKENKSLAKTIDSYIKYYTCHSHDWQNVVVKAATCTDPELSSKQCAKCDWRESEKFETAGALGHDPVEDLAIEPTQLAVGWTAGSHCARCGEVFVKQQGIPMLDPDIYAESEYHRAITEADAAALGYASLAELDAALDEAVRAAGFDPANSIRFTAQVDSSIGILPDDRFPVSGTEVLLPIPDTTAKEYYAVQVFTTDVQNTNFHPAGEFMSTRVKKYSNRIGLDLYTQAIVIVAWKAE